ncbi:HD domain-containing phosphohydrolase [Anaeromusa acidaminophila]|uniref:HD domain-containing phosphohydrolase n=1 Tax=Anaeromusa acidaminophila TaxID=81464 RepID=UPI000369A1D2|nr:HD domain-containing phosphohydrolase [Anaeromusa acidaminophila]
MRFGMQRTIRQQVGMFSLILLLCSSLALTVVFIGHEIAHLRESSVRNLQQAVVFQSQFLRNWQQHYVELAAQLALGNAAQTQNWALFKEQVLAIRDSSQEDVEILFIGDDGLEKFASGTKLLQPLYTGMQHCFQEAKAGRPVVSCLLSSQALEKQVVVFSQPVQASQGRFVGAVLVVVNADSVLSMMEKVRPVMSGTLYLVSSDNLVLTSAKEPVAAWKNSDFFEELRTSGEGIRSYQQGEDEYLQAYQKVELGGWLVVNEIPWRVVIKPINEFLQWLLLVMTGILFLSGFLIWYFSKTLEGPVQALVEGAKRVQAGEYTQPVELQEGALVPKELHSLCDSFNIMTGVIQEQMELLQEFHRLSTEAEQLLQKYRLLSEHATDIILFVRTSDQQIIEVNKAAEVAYGKTRQELLTSSLHDLYPARQEILAWDKIRRNSTKPVVEEVHRRSDDSLFFVEVSVQQLAGELQDLVVFIVRDVSERKEFEQKLRRASFHDQLTGLYNRFFFEFEMERLKKEGRGPLGILVCDVDGLKLVNDTLGHAAGDDLLRSVAWVLRRSLREQDLLFRIGGDEFVAFLPEMEESGVSGVQQRIDHVVQEHNERTLALPLFISCGWSWRHESPLPLETMFREADDAMYSLKSRQRNQTRQGMLQMFEKTLRISEPIAAEHMEEVALKLQRLGAALGMEETEFERLRRLGRYHDLGKVAIPMEILNKRELLSPSEWKEIRKHAEIGGRIAQQMPDLMDLAEAIRHHHECWDGSGYPDGLAGADIPLLSRMIAIVDAFDAMQRPRSYREGKRKEEAIEELRSLAGTQFDPELVELFLQTET